MKIWDWTAVKYPACPRHLMPRVMTYYCPSLGDMILPACRQKYAAYVVKLSAERTAQ